MKTTVQTNGELEVDVGRDAVLALHPIACVDLHISIEDDRIVVRGKVGTGRVLVEQRQGVESP